MVGSALYFFEKVFFWDTLMVTIKISYDSIFFRFCGLLSVSREVQKAATCIAKKVKNAKFI